MNMREIGRQAGVSSATVSRVINGSPLVTEETTRRVQKVLSALNFIPNPVATTLKYGRSRTYGLIIPDISNPFYSEFLGEFEEVLTEIDHELLLTNIKPGNDKMVQSVRRMLMRKVDGVVVMASEFDTEAIEPLFQHCVPIVTLDRRSVRLGCSDVSVDFEGGFRQGAEHLRKLGHKKIGFIGGYAGLRTSHIRFNAFRKGLEACGLEVDEDLVRTGDYRLAGGEAAALSLLQQRKRPTALMTVNDLTAFGAIRALHRVGGSVPNDMSIIGLDDVLLCEATQPPLTTIRLPRRRLAQALLKALLYTSEDVERIGKRFSVPAELIVRASTAAPHARVHR